MKFIVLHNLCQFIANTVYHKYAIYYLKTHMNVFYLLGLISYTLLNYYNVMIMFLIEISKPGDAFISHVIFTYVISKTYSF